MKILVTGANGFIGNHIVRRLVGEGHFVRALVRDPARADLIAPLASEMVRGDLTDPASLYGAAEGMAVVIHSGGLVGSGRGRRDDYFHINVDGTRAILAEAKRAGASRFVLMSSVAVYGTSILKGNLTEEAPQRPIGNGYVDSKIACEEVVLAGGLPYVFVRPYWVSGGGDRFLIPQVARLLQADRFTFIGSGRQQWSISAVENVGDVAALVAVHPDAAGQSYNVADATVPLSETIDVIASALDLPAPVRRSSVIGVAFRSLLNQSNTNPARMTLDLFFPLWRGATISTEKIRRELGWTPRVPWQGSIRQGALEWKRVNSGAHPATA